MHTFARHQLYCSISMPSTTHHGPFLTSGILPLDKILVVAIFSMYYSEGICDFGCVCILALQYHYETQVCMLVLNKNELLWNYVCIVVLISLVAAY